MREYLTSDDICNQMSMERTLYDGLFLVVEGVTDERLYEKFIDPGNVRIVEAHSKDNVRRTVGCMRSARKDDMVAGIVDPDLDRLNGRRAEAPVFYTDRRDMEMMIIASNALDDVLAEYADHDALERFTEDFGHVRESIVSASYPIGLLMHISVKEGLGLSFKNLDFGDFIDPRTLRLDARRMVDSVLYNSSPCRMGRKALLGRLDDAARNLDDVWTAARGHDAVAILLIGLKRSFGSFNSRHLTEGELGGALRLAFSDACFRGTDLYRDSSAWAEEKGIPLWDLSE